MPLTDHLAVVSLTREVPTRELLPAAAAVQKQVMRDFSPVWGLPATVAAFDDLASVPSDYHHVVIFDDPGELVDRLEASLGAARTALLLAEFEDDRLEGVHLSALSRQPFALVAASDSWTVTLSHEVLELIADPFCNRLVAAAHPLDPERRVNYLLEVCDPCLATWYPVNGVAVSDFYTTQYFDPVGLRGGRYSFTGALEYPLQILDGGYLSWIDPDDLGLYRLEAGAAAPVLLADPLRLARTTSPLRAIVDGDPQVAPLSARLVEPAPSAAAAMGSRAAVERASRGAAWERAASLRVLMDGARG